MKLWAEHNWLTGRSFSVREYGCKYLSSTSLLDSKITKQPSTLIKKIENYYVLIKNFTNAKIPTGLTRTRGMCSFPNSASVGQDNGLMLGITLAHETGHRWAMITHLSSWFSLALKCIIPSRLLDPIYQQVHSDKYSLLLLFSVLEWTMTEARVLMVWISWHLTRQGRSQHSSGHHAVRTICNNS